MPDSVSNALLARAASHYDVDLQGDVRLREVSLHATRRQIVAAGGELDWPGGHINYVLNSQPYAANVGPLHGRLRQRTGRLWLEVTTPATQLDALRFTLSADGWGSAAATRQFMASAGFPWPGNAAPGEFVLEVQEKLF